MTFTVPSNPTTPRNGATTERLAALIYPYEFRSPLLKQKCCKLIVKGWLKLGATWHQLDRLGAAGIMRARS